MSARNLWSLVLIVVVLVAPAGCSSSAVSDSPRIMEYPVGSGGGLLFQGTKANVPYALDDPTLCLDRRGSVTVESVEIANPTAGLRVSMFSIRPARVGALINYIESPDQRLAEVGYPTKPPMVVDRMCYRVAGTTPPPGVEPPSGVGTSLLGIEVTKPTKHTARGTGLVVTYRSGDTRYEVFVPLEIVLCEGTEERHPECRGSVVRPPDR